MIRTHNTRTRDDPANHYTIDVVRGIIPVLYLTQFIYVNVENSFMKILFIYMKRKVFHIFFLIGETKQKSKN